MKRMILLSIALVLALVCAFPQSSGGSSPKPRFVDNGNGTITDTLTDLMWQQAPSGAAINWPEANSYTSSLTLGGHKDWRLPYRSELLSLIQKDQPNTAEWLNTQGFKGIVSDNYWSGTYYYYKGDYAWMVGMRYGSLRSDSQHAQYPVLAVRGQPYAGD